MQNIQNIPNILNNNNLIYPQNNLNFVNQNHQIQYGIDTSVIISYIQNGFIAQDIETGELVTFFLPLDKESLIIYQTMVIKYYRKKQIENEIMENRRKMLYQSIENLIEYNFTLKHQFIENWYNYLNKSIPIHLLNNSFQNNQKIEELEENNETNSIYVNIENEDISIEETSRWKTEPIFVGTIFKRMTKICFNIDFNDNDQINLDINELDKFIERFMNYVEKDERKIKDTGSYINIIKDSKKYNFIYKINDEKKSSMEYFYEKISENIILNDNEKIKLYFDIIMSDRLNSLDNESRIFHKYVLMIKDCDLNKIELFKEWILNLLEENKNYYSRKNQITDKIYKITILKNNNELLFELIRKKIHNKFYLILIWF